MSSQQPAKDANDVKPEIKDQAELSNKELDQVNGGVIAVSHSIISPRDPQSGLPTG